MTNLPYDKPIEEQTTIEKLLNRAYIRRNATDRKSVAECDTDRLADLLEDAAGELMALENEVSHLRAIINGTWPGNPEADLNDYLFGIITDTIAPLTDEQFDKLFARFNDRLIFKLLSKYTMSIQTTSGHNYAIGTTDPVGHMRAVLEQELYERLTGRE